MMEKSIFGSAIKTYPSKRNRFSSYRQSCLVFKDDDPFDQLIKDEENKKPLTAKKLGIEKGAIRSTKSYHPFNHKVPVLKNIQNYSCINRKPSFIPQTKKKKVRTKILKQNKENKQKCSSRLYHSNSDIDNDQPRLSTYELSPSLNPLDDYKKRVASQSTKPEPKSPRQTIKDTNVDSCPSNDDSAPPTLPATINYHNNSSIDQPKPSPAKPNETVFKKPTVFVERSSDLFYKNSFNKNRGQTKTRKKLSFLNENYPIDDEYDVDNSFENANRLFSRISGIRRNTLQCRTSQSLVNELFNSDNENEYRCSDVFHPGTASTPNFDRNKSRLDHSCEENNAEGQEYAKSLDDTPLSIRSPSHHLSSNSISFTCLKSSPANQNETSGLSIHLTINESENISENDEVDKYPEYLDYSSNSCTGSFSENNSSSSSSNYDLEQEQSEEEIVPKNNNLVKSHNSGSHASLHTFPDNSKIVENFDDTSLNSSISKCDTNKSMTGDSESDSSPCYIKCSSPPTVVSSCSSDSSNRSEISLVKLFEEEVDKFKDNLCKSLLEESVDEFENNSSELTNRLHSCSLEDEQNRSRNVDSFPNDVSKLAHLLHSFNLKKEQAETEPDLVSVFNCSATSIPTKEMTNDVSSIIITEQSETKENLSSHEISACLPKEMAYNFSSTSITAEPEMKELSLSEIIQCLSPIHVSTGNTSENTEFTGWSSKEYCQALELKEAFENIRKESETNSLHPGEVLPAHLKHVTTRRKKTCLMPTLNEENSNLEEEEDADLCSNTRNSPLPSQHWQLSSQNQTSLHTSRFLERSSMMGHSIVLAAGKKWRRSFITLKNIRDYGFQSQTEHEDLKGRCWRKNVEELISNQLDENLEKEFGESSTIRTGSNETFLNPNYTCLDNSRRPNKARFSFCVNQQSPPPQQHQSDESSGLTSSSDTSKLFGDKSYISFVGSQQDSRIENNCDFDAGDYSRSYKVSLECYDIRDHLSAKETVLRYCKQTEPLPFEECFNNRLLQNCKKIGEGVYGEVFMLKRNPAHCSVLKIIPIEGDLLINGEKQKKFDEIVSELVISIELSDLRKRTDYYTDNFAELQKCWCVYGKYPKRLIDLWDSYNDSKGSDNDSPKVFRDNQLYIILELSHGGEDVESFVFNNASQALSVFTQVAYALAVAEQAFNFEHRDLHWGNILVSKTKQDRTTYIIGDFESTIRLRGVKVTIIDYTLSRITINNCIVFNDIGQDPDLFTAQGDFQFEVYRLMKNEVENIWNQFMPKTNVYWLCYLLDKMIKEVRYRRVATQIHRTNFKRLKEFYDLILGFASCHELICHAHFTRTVSAIR